MIEASSRLGSKRTHPLREAPLDPPLASSLSSMPIVSSYDWRTRSSWSKREAKSVAVPAPTMPWLRAVERCKR